MNTHDELLFFTQLSKLHRNYSKALSMRLETYDVKPGYLSILHSLWEKDRITQKELNIFIDIEQATLSNSLSRMERDGLIDRITNPKDRRQVYIVLTEKAQSIQSAVNAAIKDLQTIVNTGLTINDRRYFFRILKHMNEQLNDDLSDPFLMLFDEVAD